MDMQEVVGENYRVSYDPMLAVFVFEGSLRLSSVTEYSPIADLLDGAIAQDTSTITLNLKSLEFLNSSGISMLSKFVINIRKKKTVQIIVKGSHEIPWQSKSLKNLQRLMPGLELEID